MTQLPHHLSPAFPIMSTSRKMRRGEIEKYGRLYFEYTKLFEDHSAILREDTKESSAAHARISKEFEAKLAGSLPASARSIKQIRSYMDELARRCKVKAQSFDEWVDLFVVKLKTNPLFLAICVSASVLQDISSFCSITLSMLSMWGLFSKSEVDYCKSQVT